MINELCKKAHANAVNKGFWEEEKGFAEQIALMHSELSEALEDFRDGKKVTKVNCGNQTITCHTLNGLKCEHSRCDNHKPCGIPIEFADVLIRIFDTCGHYGIDLEQAIEIKMKYNESRSYKHGKVI